MDRHWYDKEESPPKPILPRIYQSLLDCDLDPKQILTKEGYKGFRQWHEKEKAKEREKSLCESSIGPKVQTAAGRGQEKDSKGENMEGRIREGEEIVIQTNRNGEPHYTLGNITFSDNPHKPVIREQEPDIKYKMSVKDNEGEYDSVDDWRQGKMSTKSVGFDPVRKPFHYNQKGIECIDAIEAALTEDEFRGYLKGNMLKYTWRERYKGKAIEDLKKAADYCNRLLIFLTKEKTDAEKK